MAIIIFSDSTLFAEKKEKKEKHWLSMVNLHCILEKFKRIKKKKMISMNYFLLLCNLKGNWMCDMCQYQWYFFIIIIMRIPMVLNTFCFLIRRQKWHVSLEFG